MDHRLIEGLMEAVAPVIKDAQASAIEKAISPLLLRVAELEARGVDAVIERTVADAVARLPPAKDGNDGKDADTEEIKASIVAEVEKAATETRADLARLVDAAVAELPVPKDGKDSDPEEVRALIAEAVAALPRPADGKDADPEVVAELVAEAVGTAVAALPAPQDGKSVTLDDVRPVIAEAVAAIPRPADGRDVDPESVAALVAEAVGKAAAALPAPLDGKSGIGLAGAVIDRSGALVITLTDGSTRELGLVVGRDADQAALERMIADKIASIPKPKDGIDGLGFHDMTEELADDGRTIVRRYTRADQVKEFRHSMAVVLDKGVWRPGEYVKGDGVTLNGSFFIAQRDTAAKPETPDAKDDWRLAVKRGRDGRDFRPEVPHDPPIIKLK